MKDSVENYTFLWRHSGDLICWLVSKGTSWLVGLVVSHLGRRCVLERKCFLPPEREGNHIVSHHRYNGFFFKPVKFLGVVVKTVRWYYIYIKVHDLFKTWQRIRSALKRHFWCKVKRERCCFGEGGTIVLAAWASDCFNSLSCLHGCQFWANLWTFWRRGEIIYTVLCYNTVL